MTKSADKPVKATKATKATKAKGKVVKQPVAKLNPLADGSDYLQCLFKRKNLDDPFVQINEDNFTKPMPHIPTGSIMIDYLIGGRLNRYGVPSCPGMPRGKIVNLYGRESAGKTTLALMTAAQTCAAGGTVAYIDWEHAIVVDYAESLGVPVRDPNKFVLLQPMTLEEGLMSIFTYAAKGVDLIVIDSVGAGIPKAVIEQLIDEKGSSGRVGAIAQIWSTCLPQLRHHITKNGSCLLGISQLRKNINTTGYGGDGSVTQGGEAWKFYSDVRLSMVRIKSEKGKEYDHLSHSASEAVATGAEVRVRADKCKVSSSQGRDVSIYLRYGHGIDDLRSRIEFAFRHGLMRKDGSWIQWQRADGTILKSQGMAKFREMLETAEGAEDEIYEMTTAAIFGSSVEDITAQSEKESLEETAMKEVEALLAAANSAGVPVAQEEVSDEVVEED